MQSNPFYFLLALFDCGLSVGTATSLFVCHFSSALTFTHTCREVASLQPGSWRSFHEYWKAKQPAWVPVLVTKNMQLHSAGPLSEQTVHTRSYEARVQSNTCQETSRMLTFSVAQTFDFPLVKCDICSQWRRPHFASDLSLTSAILVLALLSLMSHVVLRTRSKIMLTVKWYREHVII